ncbi:helix-turn-helix transcriptional regulator [Leucobacter komagatae]|uniref:Proteasome accessory factor C n=1 Tax=Leucobacter komagatae TaxID=55969 RepID=A0A0D0IVA9_9MICO|nr:WYL domain-containing protein [Leucobacter komagatae]KIP53533.1 hypothetical protein SD72_02240 [Leucobacter komagatae]
MARPMLAADRVLLLLSLVPYLREHGPTPIAELARTFDVDPRMLRNLIGFLGTAGIPGETLSYQHNDLFDIDWDEFEERDTVSLTQTVAIDETPRFTGVETAALLAGLAALQPLLSDADADLAAALGERLAAVMGSASLPAVVVSAMDATADLPALVGAVDAGMAVRFSYRDAHGVDSVRTVHPTSLMEREGTWYLHGYNVERDAQRTFSVAQLSDLEVLERFAPPPAPAGGGASSGAASREVDSITEMLAIVPVRLLGAIRGFAPQEASVAGVEIPEGSVLVKIDAWHAGAAVRLAQHGPGEIEIVAPPSARAAVSAWAEEALAAYGEQQGGHSGE